MNLKPMLVAASIAAMCLSAVGAEPMVINVKPVKGDATRTLQKAIDRAARQNGRPVEIRLAPGEYHISKAKSTGRLYHVSNTTTETEAPDQTKHIGLFMKGISNLTVDGRGAKFITHGEMTPWVVDSCSNVTLKNFSLDAADPSVPEMTVTEVSDTAMTVKVHPWSKYEIRNGKLWWTGEGWEFTNGIAQIYSTTDTTSMRADSPVEFCNDVTETAPGELRFRYKKRNMSGVEPGFTYQMRHSFRTEVAGFINRSSDVTLSDLNLHFLGNFGIVAQFSTNLTYKKVNCSTAPESGRVNAGFADFFQVSGCKGYLTVDSCYFAGSHDDPINVHGTHLRIVESPSAERLRVRFMHGQTRGFQAFYPGDTVAVVDSRSLIRKAVAVVKEAKQDGVYNMDIVLDRELTDEVRGLKNAVLENVTWSPSVDITNSYFGLTPTRGILMTTWRPVRIEGNVFYRCPMASILVADDARSWYESGPVMDLLVKGNRFIDCVSPVISIAPENAVMDGAVHKKIAIEDNVFELSGRFALAGEKVEIRARSVEQLKVTGNTVVSPVKDASLKVVTVDCKTTIID